MKSLLDYLRAARFATAALVLCWLTSACTVLAVADTVGTVAVKTVGVAADAAIGTVKIAGQAVGKVADVATGNSGK